MKKNWMKHPKHIWDYKEKTQVAFMDMSNTVRFGYIKIGTYHGTSREFREFRESYGNTFTEDNIMWFCERGLFLKEMKKIRDEVYD